MADAEASTEREAAREEGAAISETETRRRGEVAVSSSGTMAGPGVADKRRSGSVAMR
jgi:hypothetical protein